MKPSNTVLGLYILTLVLELIGAAARYTLVWVLFIFIKFIPRGWVIVQDAIALTPYFGQRLESPGFLQLINFIGEVGVVVGLIFAFYPLAISLYALVSPSSGFILTRLSFGARDPSEHEAERLRYTIEQIRGASSAALYLPTAYYVINHTFPIAYSLGTTLYVTDALIQSPFLAPVLAHEFGHINSSDARMQLALTSLTLSWLQLLAGGLGSGAVSGMFSSAVRGNVGGALFMGGMASVAGLSFLSRGGIGLGLLRPLWSQYWQGRDYVADQFAADCGEADGLAEYLEKYDAFDDGSLFAAPSKPFTELRIDRLRSRAQQGTTGAVLSQTMQTLQSASPAPITQSAQGSPQGGQPPGIPSGQANRQGLVLIGVIAAIVLGTFAISTAPNSAAHKSITDIRGWKLERSCGYKNCEPMPPPAGQQTYALDFISIYAILILHHSGGDDHGSLTLR